MAAARAPGSRPARGKRDRGVRGCTTTSPSPGEDAAAPPRLDGAGKVGLLLLSAQSPRTGWQGPREHWHGEEQFTPKYPSGQVSLQLEERRKEGKCPRGWGSLPCPPPHVTWVPSSRPGRGRHPTRGHSSPKRTWGRGTGTHPRRCPQGRSCCSCRDKAGRCQGAGTPTRTCTWEAVAGGVPGSHPAGLAVQARPGLRIAGVPVPAAGARLEAALAVEAGGAALLAQGPVPAGLARQAEAIHGRAGLAVLAVPAAARAQGWRGFGILPVPPKKMLHPTRAAQTSPSPTYLPIQPKGRMYPVDFPPRSAPSSPVHTLRPVFPRRAGLPAAPALVPGDAAAVPAEGVAGAVQTVAAPLAPQPPKPSLALALARLLGAGREVAGALEAAPPAPPARQAVAVPGQGVAVRVGGVALALLLAAG